jgi:hypothetical protein
MGQTCPSVASEFGLALRHLPNTSPPNVNPSPAASLAMPLKRPADSLGRPLHSFGLAYYALRHLPNTCPPNVNPSPAASLAMPLKRPADSLGRPLHSFGLAY